MSHRPIHRSLIAVVGLAILALFCSAPVAAQETRPPKCEIFGGYSFFYPAANIRARKPGALLPISGPLTRQESNPRGFGASLTCNATRWLGFTGDFSDHFAAAGNDPSPLDDAAFLNVSFGPKLTFRRNHFAPFAEALFGLHRLDNAMFGPKNAFGMMFGGGLDVPLTKHFGLRVLRGDYVHSNHSFGSEPATQVRGVRLQTGLIFMFGGGDATRPISAACTASPAAVIVGEPIAVTSTPSNFNPKHALSYDWKSTGGQVTGTATNATVDTHGLAAGNYVVTSRISDPKARKAGDAICRSNFSVREAVPPAISCTSSPSTVQSGAPSTVSCTCTSPDNASVNVGDWTSDGGTVQGTGSTAMLNTTGASAGSISVNAVCTDSRGLNGRATTKVAITLPAPVVSASPAPSMPEASRELESRLALHSVYFATAKPSQAKPDGGLLPSQEQTLTSLAADFEQYLRSRPDAHLVLVGHTDPRGSTEYNQALSERRVGTTKQALIDHGVPADHIDTRAFGEQRNLTDAQVKQAVESTPQLTAEQRQKVLDNMSTIILASNRRVDISLSTTGQESTQVYPFNAADSLALLSQDGTSKNKKIVRKAKATK